MQMELKYIRKKQLDKVIQDGLRQRHFPFTAIMLIIAQIFHGIGNTLWVSYNITWIDPYWQAPACVCILYWAYKSDDESLQVLDRKILYVLCTTLTIFQFAILKFPGTSIFRYCGVPNCADTMGIIRLILYGLGLFRAHKCFALGFAVSILISVIDETDGSLARAAECKSSYGEWLDHEVLDQFNYVWPLVLAHFAHPNWDPLWYVYVHFNFSVSFNPYI